MTTKKTDPGADGAFGKASRRGFLKGLSVAVATASVVSPLARKALAQTTAPSRPAGGLGSSAESTLFHVVETTSGKVQGIATAGIKEFKGIPYGSSTSGKNRFMPPKKPVAWTGVRECFTHGQCCPQTLSSLRSEYGMMIQ